MENKYRIFCEYIYCDIIKYGFVRQLTPENLINSVENGWKLYLKSVYDMPIDLQFEIVNEIPRNPTTGKIRCVITEIK